MIEINKIEYSPVNEESNATFFSRPIAALLLVVTLFVFQLRMRNSTKFRSAQKIPSSPEKPIRRSKNLGFQFLHRKPQNPDWTAHP